MVNSPATMRKRLALHDLPRVQIDAVRRDRRAYLALSHEEALWLLRALVRTREISSATLRGLAFAERELACAPNDRLRAERVARAIASHRLWVHLRAAASDLAGGGGSGEGAADVLREPPPEAAPPEGIDIDFDLVEDFESHVETETLLDDGDEPHVDAEAEVEDDDEPHVDAEAEVEDDDEPHVDAEALIEDNDAD